METGPALLPVTLAPLPEIQYPTGLVPPVKASATVYEAPGATVAALGVPTTEPPAVWQEEQADARAGCADAACGLRVTARSAATAPVASTAIFGRLIFFRVKVFTSFSRIRS